ncbi:Solute carrier organic anion transporter family member 1C1 [Manis javanica]|nr:Solute carrier organic anion transporter family member 1C1 [Manis javanica]
MNQSLQALSVRDKKPPASSDTALKSPTGRHCKCGEAVTQPGCVAQRPAPRHWQVLSPTPCQVNTYC